MPLSEYYDDRLKTANLGKKYVISWRVRQFKNTPYYSVARPRPLADPETALWLAQLGGRIKEVRRSQKMTQEKLAEIADITPRTLQKLEAGQFSCLVSTLRRIRKGLGCSYDDILPE